MNDMYVQFRGMTTQDVIRTDLQDVQVGWNLDVRQPPTVRTYHLPALRFSGEGKIANPEPTEIIHQLLQVCWGDSGFRDAAQCRFLVDQLFGGKFGESRLNDLLQHARRDRVDSFANSDQSNRLSVEPALLNFE